MCFESRVLNPLPFSKEELFRNSIAQLHSAQPRLKVLHNIDWYCFTTSA